MPDPRDEWLAELQQLAVALCHSVVLIKGPPDLRPWNAEQVVWSGEHGPAPSDEVFAYRALGATTDHVALLGERSREHFSRFVEVFQRGAGEGAWYGVAFLRDMLVGLLELSLPGATLEQLPSPYWKRYVAPAAAELKAGSPQRYGEAVATAVRALPLPHPPTIVALPVAGIALLGVRRVGGVELLPAATCAGDPELSGCAMFLRRLKELQQARRDEPLVFAKLSVPAEPGLAVERAAQRIDAVCRLLRLIPNPGLADGPLCNPPRIDLDAADSAAFYIGKYSVGTHPIPVRRATSDPQGRLSNWRVEPRLAEPRWQRLGAIIERGATCDLEARLLAGLRHLGEAQAEPCAGVAVYDAAQALQALLAAPQGSAPDELAALFAALTAAAGEAREARRAACLRLCRLEGQLTHDLERPVPPAQRAEAIWTAFEALAALLARDDLRGHAELIAAVNTGG